MRLFLLMLSTSFFISFGKTNPKLITFNAIDISPDTKEIIITFIVPEKDFIYRDFITCSVQEPTVALSTWKTDKQSINQYDPEFKETKQIFNETFSISMTIIATPKACNSEPIHLYCSYYRASEKKINHTIFTFIFSQLLEKNEYPDDPLLDNQQSPPFKKNNSSFSSIDDYFIALLYILKNIIKSLKTESKKYLIIIVLIFCLLILMSHFLKSQLQKHTKINEIFEFIFSLVIVSSIAYAFLFLQTIAIPLITVSIACICTFSAGLFYTKKSTKFQSGYLRTLCTFIGMLLICSTIFLLFKTMQYAQDQFHYL